MNRNVKQYAEQGMKHITARSDIYAEEFKQLYAIREDYQNTDSALYEIISTAFCFGYEVGLRSKGKQITGRTKLSEIRKMLADADAEEKKRIVAAIKAIDDSEV